MTFKTLIPFRSLCLVSLIGVATISTPAQANDTYCGMDGSNTVAKDLDGFWEVKNGVGTLDMMGRTMALPSGQLSDGAIETADDGTMTITSSEMPGVFPVKFDTGPDWKIDLKENSTLDSKDVITTLDLGVLIDCEPNSLPRLHATGSFPDEGGTVDFDLYLFVISKDLMYGATIGKIASPQGSGTAKRLVTFSR